MISLFIAFTGLSFFFLCYRFPRDESGKPIPNQQRKQQLLAGLVLLILAIADFLVAPMGGIPTLSIRIFSAIWILIFAGKAARQVATAIYYLTAMLILLRGIMDYIKPN